MCADCQCQGFCGVGKAPRAAGRWSRDTREVYERACAHLRVQPSRAFSKQCKHAVVELRDSKMGPGDIKPIAIALVVSIGFPLIAAFIAMFIKTNTSILKRNCLLAKIRC